MLVINLLEQPQVNELRNKINQIPFVDGKLTAQGDAKSIKNNQQITQSSSKEAREFLTGIQNSLVQNAVFRNYTYFRQFVDIMVNKYGPGETYGWHYDNHLIKGQRTDISFTLFLSDPESYEGGELELKYPNFIKKIKGKAGQMVIYPTGVIHQVTPVLSGERVSIVGWAQSWVKRFEDREMLNAFNAQINTLKTKIDKDSHDQLKAIYQHFFREVSS